ncbi:integral membrane sensor signal transduction histidine kinase [Bifidobacterium saguini DSM 23967]|uniref:histidine kinase n=2 Tax=Bifidobacterium saguini TaxID=762210 RepID=A0A087D9P5_9BIFI|nr:HAMP domain-containing sensor histidine kinase [Bifidobacterium saguini]KFI92245.1 integral membrane sensor signal transduction histidine kinase [Bifidobacterium saguini DSM 23967]QTB90955.1 HAMP domain-containing histidine kinase [Bifidobacterium saguini]
MQVIQTLRTHLAAVAGKLTPQSFRAKITLAIALIIIVMMTALIITQNVIVAHTTAEASQTMTMCANSDGTISVTTGTDAETGPASNGTGDSALVCYTGTRRNLDGMKLYVPFNSEEWDTAKEQTQNGSPWILDEYNGVMINTANAVTNTLTTTMRTVSIVTLAIFGLIAVLAAWFIGTMLSRRITAVDRQVAALQPNDLSARIDVKPGHDDIDRLVDSINGMLERVEASAAAERRFVSNASHELRTPIAAVETNLDAPLAQGRFPADVEPSVRRALAANRRGAELVQALLTLSRIQSGTIGGSVDNETPEAASNTDLHECVNQALTDVDAVIADNIITVNVEGNAAVPANPALLKLAVGNLLRNAAMHNVENGSIDVAISTTQDTNRDGNDDKSTNEASLTVTNSTDEALPDDLAELIQPFHRGQNSRISATPGVGLGLSIVDAACQAMHATLELTQPTPNKFQATIRF